jgi:hypothetical protein
VGLRDRAIIAVMTYTFARVGAVVALTVEDYSRTSQEGPSRLKYYRGIQATHGSSSNDSRVRGFVDRSDIYGKAVFVFWPLDKIGRVR